MKNKVKDLILKIKQGNKEIGDEFISELLNSKFFTVHYLNEQKEMISLKSDDHQVYYALCTDLKEALKFKGDLEIKVLYFSDFLFMLDDKIKDVGMVIDPFGLSLNFNPGFLNGYYKFIKSKSNDLK